MLACLLIENLNDCMREMINILDFYTPTYLAPRPLKTERQSPLDLSEAVPVMPDEIPACPKCEIADEKSIYINLEVDAMTTKANEFVKNLLIELKENGIQARIGIAASRFVSFVAANNASPTVPCIVPSDDMEPFLADQSVSLLPILPETLRCLKRFGLQKLGQVACINSRNLTNQFAIEGALISDLVRGIDPTPLTIYQRPKDAGSEAWQPNIWGHEAKSSQHLKPKPITVMSKKIGYIDFPQAIHRRGTWVCFDAIIDYWKLANNWWTGHLQNLDCFYVSIYGHQLTICHDLACGSWSRY